MTGSKGLDYVPTAGFGPGEQRQETPSGDWRPGTKWVSLDRNQIQALMRWHGLQAENADRQNKAEDSNYHTRCMLDLAVAMGMMGREPK
jgi:hypothetical protein